MNAYANAPLRLTNMYATILDVWASVPARKFRMLSRTELLDVFVQVQSNTVVLILGIPHSTIGACGLVEFTCTKGVFYAFDVLDNGILCTGRIDVIIMFGREQVTARLELLAVGR
eukprot:8991444-Pyramimonas_sp.AAC.1